MAVRVRVGVVQLSGPVSRASCPNRLFLTDNRAASNAVMTTAIVTLLSYVSGGLALGASGTSYAASINLFAAVLSLLVGAIACALRL